MAAYRNLDAVCYQLARQQAHAHAVMVHGGAVRHGDGGHRHRHAAAFGHTQARMIGLRPQRLRAGRVVTGRTDDANHGLFKVRVVQPGGTQEGTVRGT